MKIRRLIVIAGFSMAIAALVSVALVSRWRHLQTFKSLPKLVAAERNYLRDYCVPQRTWSLPASVTLQDLVKGGYISTDDVRVFDCMDVTFYPMANDNNPQAILVRVQMRDGAQIAAFADGSIAQLPYQPPK